MTARRKPLRFNVLCHYLYIKTLSKRRVRLMSFKVSAMQFLVIYDVKSRLVPLSRLALYCTDRSIGKCSATIDLKDVIISLHIIFDTALNI